MKCCAAITEPSIKMACTANYEAIKSSGDAACGIAYMTLNNAGFCP